MTPEPTAASPARTETPTAQGAPAGTAPPALAPRSGVVRGATADDAAEAAWLAALTFPLACPPEASRPDIAAHVARKLTLAHFSEWVAHDERALLVYDDGTRLLGYALLVLGAPGGAAEADAVRAASGREGPYVELSKIYVHPEAMGSGIAGELMRSAIDTAAELGPGLPLWLGTNALNLRAQTFYRKHGFDVIGKRTLFVGTLECDDVVLLRTRP